jgi:hypothetical protein
MGFATTGSKPKRWLNSQANVRTYMRTNPVNWSHISGRAGHYNVRRQHRLRRVRISPREPLKRGDVPAVR